MSANGLHDDTKRAMALDAAVEVTASHGNGDKTRQAAELFYAFLTGQTVAKPSLRVVGERGPEIT